jgi:hypothetical protein
MNAQLHHVDHLTTFIGTMHKWLSALFHPAHPHTPYRWCPATPHEAAAVEDGLFCMPDSATGASALAAGTNSQRTASSSEELPAIKLSSSEVLKEIELLADGVLGKGGCMCLV